MMGDGWMAGPLPWLAVLVFTLLFHLGILANPGFYSHDEWEKFDQLRALGLWDAVRPYLRLQAGAEFGHPVRPVGFVQQLVSAHWMAMAPFLPHLVDVLLHALVSVVVLFALRDAGAAPGLSLLVALAFSASPLTTTATGWVSASFDQWYVLFACLAGWAAWRAATEGLTFRRCLWLLAAAAGAILSKEAAVMLPAAIVLMLGLAWLERGSLRNRPAILAILLALLPIAAYLLLRLPALQASFAGQAHATYAPSSATSGPTRSATSPFRSSRMAATFRPFRPGMRRASWREWACTPCWSWRWSPMRGRATPWSTCSPMGCSCCRCFRCPTRRATTSTGPLWRWP
jgi:hypothetical protein